MIRTIVGRLPAREAACADSSNPMRDTAHADTALGARTSSCVIDARPTSEPDDATPADRCTLLGAHEQAALYLRPGKYRVRAWGVSGRTLGERRIAIGNGK
jgi:hypothetical protein